MNILIAAAHPDDELLGCGGTIAKHREAGDQVFALILGEGQTSRFESREAAGEEILKELHSDTERAAAILGIKKVYFENFPDNSFDSVPLLSITKSVERLVDEIKPTIIYTHHGGDLNVDHRRTFEAVVTATRPMEDCPAKEIYAFPTLSSTEWSFGSGMGVGGAFVGGAFAPNVFNPITGEQLGKKLSAMECYKSELREFPHPRSLKMLEIQAVYFGGICGHQYAEAFECVRIVR